MSLIDELARLGPFFAVDVRSQIASRGESSESSSEDVPPPPWLRVRDLLEHPGVLEARVAAVRRALAAGAGRETADVHLRVAASVMQLGLVARLVGPAVAARALGVGLDLDPDRVWWQDRLGGPVPLSVTFSSGPPAPITAGAIECVTTAVDTGFAVGDRVLWGNVGSAVNSAVGAIAASRPDLLATARSVADSVLAQPRIDGGVLRSSTRFRRRSCCLIYRVSGDRSAACGDCVLR